MTNGETIPANTGKKSEHMAMIDLNTKEIAAKLSVINKNVLIILPIVFGAALFYLFILYMKLNNNFTEYVINDARKSTQIIQDNANKQDEAIEVLRDIKDVLLENRAYLKQAKEVK